MEAERYILPLLASSQGLKSSEIQLFGEQRYAAARELRQLVDEGFRRSEGVLQGAHVLSATAHRGRVAVSGAIEEAVVRDAIVGTVDGGSEAFRLRRLKHGF